MNEDTINPTHPAANLLQPSRSGTLPRGMDRRDSSTNFVDFILKNGAEPKPEPVPVPPRQLAQLVTDYEVVRDAYEAKVAEREQYSTALAKTKAQHRATAQQVAELTEAYQAAILTEGRADAKADLKRATEELADLAETKLALTEKFKTFPLDDTSAWHTVRGAQGTLLRHLAKEELKRIPAGAITTLRAAFSLALQAGSASDWGDWLGVSLPEPNREEAVDLYNEALARHKVTL